MGNRVCLDAEAMRKIPSPFQEPNPGRPDRSPIAILTELPRLYIYIKLD